jgi:hypothetical protein
VENGGGRIWWRWDMVEVEVENGGGGNGKRWRWKTIEVSGVKAVGTGGY